LLARGVDSAFEFRQAFGEPAHALANFNQAKVNGLQLDQIFEVWVHLPLILAQA
jgi:hypothetical protein